MKLSKEERNFIENIVAISALNKKSIKTFFRSLLVACTMSVFTGDDEIYIPYLCKLNIKYNKSTKNKNKINVKLKAEPSIELIAEIENIANNRNPNSKKYFQKEIFEKLKNILEIEELELEI